MKGKGQTEKRHRRKKGSREGERGGRERKRLGNMGRIVKGEMGVTLKWKSSQAASRGLKQK